MSVVDVTARIQQIQAQLALLAPARVTAAGGTGTGTAFAATLDAASATAFADPPVSLPDGTGSSGDAVVAEARKYLGVPYVWGGTDPDKGLDCSGLIQLVYKNLGYDIPRVSWQQAKTGLPVSDLDHARPGDILAFGSPVHHVGIYIGDGRMIEAPRPGKDVRVSEVYETPTAIRRVITGLPGAAGVSPTARASSSDRVDGSVPYARLFNAAGERYGVDADLLAAVARQESGYNPRAVSHAGAQGLMQLMPATARGLGVENAFDPAQAVDGAARLLRDLLGRFGRTDLALAAYNAGPGAVLRYDGIPPYRETQNYVRSVMAMLEDA